MKRPSPRATRIGAILHEEHRTTLSALNDLEMMVARPAPPPNDPTLHHRLEALAAVLDADVGRHFDFEETNLFPILRAAGAGFMVDMLLTEHGAIRPLAVSVRDAARDALANGFSSQSWATFKSAGAQLAELETFHIQKEEMGLIGALGNVIDAHRDQALVDLYESSAPPA